MPGVRCSGRCRDPCEELLRCLEEFRGSTIEELDWRDFESHCATVLEANGYTVLGSVWFRDQSRRYQIDVVGVLLNRVLCMDCKAWRSGGGSWRSKKAAEAQRERTIKLKESASAKGLGSSGEMTFYPMVVTLMNEDPVIHGGVPVVPFEKLNAFVVSFELYEDELFGVFADP